MSNATHRVFFDYMTGNAPGVSKEHTVMFRIMEEGQTPGDAIEQAQEAFLSMLQAIGTPALRQGWRVLRGRIAAAGTDFSLPFDMDSSLETTVGTGTTSGWTGHQEAIQYTWVGRSFTTGKRVRLSLYGINITVVDSNFRLLPSENANVALAVPATLNAQPTLVAVDNTLVNWYNYCNVQYNSYWERRIRRG